MFALGRALIWNAVLLGVMGLTVGSGPACAASNSATSSEAQRLLEGKQPSQAGKRLKPTIHIPEQDYRADGAGPVSSDGLFRLETVIIEGATALSEEHLASSYAGLLGRDVAASDLQAVTETITKLYQEAGFNLTRAVIPPQDIVDGQVRVRVVEGYIADIAVQGTDAASFGLDRILAGLREEQPLTQRGLERHLLLANEIPGIRVTDTTLDEIGEMSGRFRLTVIVEAWGVHVASGLHNRGTSAVGRLEGSVSASLNSVAIAGDTVGMGVSNTPFDPDELQLGRVGYTAPIGSRGATASINYSYGIIAPGDVRRRNDTHTTSQQISIAGTFVAMRTRPLSIKLRLGGDVTDVDEEDDIGKIYDDRVRALSIASDIEVQDSLGGITFLSAQLRHGVDWLDATERSDPLSSREGASGAFTSGQLSATRFQKLSDQWSFAVSAAGQIASSPLLSVEEFYLGGGMFGRAFDGGVIGGDSGIAGSLEARFDQELVLGPLLGYQLYGFVDHGHVWNHGPGIDNEDHLTSAGGGVRLYLARDLEAEIEVAAPLDESFDATGVRDWSVYFAVSKALKLCAAEAAIACFSGP